MSCGLALPHSTRIRSQEAVVAADLVGYMFKRYGLSELAGKVAILTPYRSQMHTIKNVLSQRFDALPVSQQTANGGSVHLRSALIDVDVMTVDSCQGQVRQ